MLAVSDRPKTRAIKEYVLNQLATGRLKHGDCLPHETELARSLGVGRYSVRQALAELSRAGMVQRIKKRGTIVTLQRPNAQPKSVGSGFALVIPEIRSGIYPSLIKGFSEAAGALHQQSMVCETEMNVFRQGDTFLRLQSQIAGVAVVPVMEAMPDYQLEALRSHGIPVVFCHRRTTTMEAPLIRWSWDEVGRLAAATLAELGHRQVAFADVMPSAGSEGYLAGFRSELQRREIPFSDEFVFFGSHSLVDAEAHYAEELVSRLLQHPRRPTGVFCADDYLSERLFLAAVRQGLRVPADLSIIGFGPTYRDGPVRSGLAAVTVDEAELGRHAARLLNEMHLGRRPLDFDEEIVLEVTVARGESLGPPARSCGES